MPGIHWDQVQWIAVVLVWTVLVVAQATYDRRLKRLETLAKAVADEKPEHEHKFELVDVQHYDIPQRVPVGMFGTADAGGGPVIPHTVVLYRCPECKGTTTHTVVGTWSREQIAGQSVGKVIDELTKLDRPRP